MIEFDILRCLGACVGIVSKIRIDFSLGCFLWCLQLFVKLILFSEFFLGLKLGFLLDFSLEFVPAGNGCFLCSCMIPA